MFDFPQEFLDTDERVVKLGDGMYYMYIVDGDNPRSGIFFIHTTDSGNQCVETYDIEDESNTPFYEGDKWQVIGNDYENLTLMPSIICTVCGKHGHITNNTWDGSFDTMERWDLEKILQETEPLPHRVEKQTGVAWYNELTYIKFNKAQEAAEVAASLADVGDFWNPIVIKDGVVVDGRVRIYVAVSTGHHDKPLRVQVITSEEESDEMVSGEASGGGDG